MKFAVLLTRLVTISVTILSLTTGLNSAYATEEASENNDIPIYCDEQAQLAGIEDAAEKAQYVKECIDSFAIPAVEYQQPDQ